MKGSISITFTRHTGRFSRLEKTEQVTFDDEQSSFLEAALAVIGILDEYV